MHRLTGDECQKQDWGVRHRQECDLLKQINKSIDAIPLPMEFSASLSPKDVSQKRTILLSTLAPLVKVD
jgi:hypothetical protein